MKKILYILVVISLLNTCKSSKNLPEENNPVSFDSPWTVQQYSPTKADDLLPLSYESYLLDITLFKAQLESGTVELPMLENRFHNFEIEASDAFPAALQKKYPDLKSYKGQSLSNTLCQCTIDQKKDQISVAIFCNDRTIFIKDLFKNGIYFIYNKKDIPAAGN